MLSRLKNYFWILLGVGAFYFLLTHHIIIFSFKDFELLKKIEPTLEHTFISLKQANPSKILMVDPLRDAGIEEIMLDRGILSEKKLDEILDYIDKQAQHQQ